MEDVMNKKIGELIRKARKMRGFSQQELGDTVNLSADMISHIEKGNRALKVVEVKKFAEALDVPEVYFLLFENNMEGLEMLTKSFFTPTELPKPLQSMLISICAYMSELGSPPDMLIMRETGQIVVEAKQSHVKDPTEIQEYFAAARITLGLKEPETGQRLIDKDRSKLDN